MFFCTEEEPCADVNPAYCEPYVAFGRCNQLKNALHRVCRLSCSYCKLKGKKNTLP